MNKVEDILKGGYSKFSPVVMKDTTLHLKSKAIYLFLCAYKNEHNIATPKRDTIMNYLGIGSKDTYYKYIKELEAHGYIKTTTLRLSTGFFNNQYEIVKTLNDKDLFKNYGIIPRDFMNDKSIPIDTKAIYGYLCAFRNKKTNDVVFTNLSQIKAQMGIGSETRLNKNIKLLIEAGYLEKRQYKNDKRFSSNLYHFLGYRENINVKDSNLTDEEVTEITRKSIEMRDLKNKTQKQVIENENRLKKEINAYVGLLKDNFSFGLLMENQAKYENIKAKVNSTDELNYYIKNLGIDTQIYDFTNDIINIITRVAFSDVENVKISNVEYPKTLIKEMFLSLRLEHIQDVLKRYRKANYNDFIKNPSGYIETVLMSVCFDYGLVKIRRESYGA